MFVQTQFPLTTSTSTSEYLTQQSTTQWGSKIQEALVSTMSDRLELVQAQWGLQPKYCETNSISIHIWLVTAESTVGVQPHIGLRTGSQPGGGAALEIHVTMRLDLLLFNAPQNMICLEMESSTKLNMLQKMNVLEASPSHSNFWPESQRRIFKSAKGKHFSAFC